MIQGVIQLLVDDSTVQSLTGEDSEGYPKVYPVVAPQDVKKPYYTVRIIGNNPNQCKDGSSTLDKVFFDVISYGEDYGDIDSLDNAARSVLDNFRGTKEGINFSRVFFQTHEDLFDQNDRAYIRKSTFHTLVKR